MSATFYFEEFENSDNAAAFKYRVVQADGSEVVFTEKLAWPEQFKLSSLDENLRATILTNLHLMLGVSYWKLNCAPTVYQPYKLTKAQSDFWHAVYQRGLGEFFYRNKLDVNLSPKFEASSEEASQPTQLKTSGSILLGFSGGKDSLVALNLLVKNGLAFTPFIIETNRNQNKTFETLQSVSAVKPVVIERVLDSALFEKQKYSGHVPVSAIIAWVGVLLAAMSNSSYVVVGNERSASEANTDYQGIEVNHQWSKSKEFEKLMQNFVSDNISPNLQYFSLLRPLSELKIVSLIASDKKLLDNFVSCNKNFVIGASDTKRWCGECAKCASTFALLSAFVPKSQLTKLFGKNMYADSSLTSLYKALLGIEGVKPFDCVGSLEEIQTAFWQAHQKGEYKNEPMMEIFERELLSTLKDPKATFDKLMSPEHIEQLPLDFQALVKTD